MVIGSGSASLPNLSGYGGYGAGSTGVTPSAASTPLSGGAGYGYSMTDSFEAAPGQCPAEGGGGGGVALTNVTGDPTLLQATQQIAQDPVGARLVQAAQAPGLQLQVAPLPAGVMGLTQNGTITLSPQAASNAPDLIHTLGHELGHAATPADGDSITEEQVVDQLGQQIQQRIAPGPTFQLDLAAYQGQGLPVDNGIRASLAKLGL
jgi:hypothetical protein